VRAARPFGAQLTGKRLCALVARPGEGEHAPALVDGDLADDVRRRAEAVDPEPSRVAGHPERAEADQARAQQRRGLEVREAVGQREAEARLGDGGFGVAAVDVEPGEARPLAEVLPAGAAEAAVAVGPAEPRDPDPRARRVRRAVPGRLDGADDLMARDDRKPRAGDLAVEDVQ